MMKHAFGSFVFLSMLTVKRMIINEMKIIEHKTNN